MTFLAPKSKLLFHPERVEEFIKTGKTSAPVNVEISPTNFCNATCPWCFYVSSDYKQKQGADKLEGT